MEDLLQLSATLPVPELHPHSYKIACTSRGHLFRSKKRATKTNKRYIMQICILLEGDHLIIAIIQITLQDHIIQKNNKLPLFQVDQSNAHYFT
jgi:hypothetical protein